MFRARRTNDLPTVGILQSTQAHLPKALTDAAIGFCVRLALTPLWLGYISHQIAYGRIGSRNQRLKGHKINVRMCVVEVKALLALETELHWKVPG